MKFNGHPSSLGVKSLHQVTHQLLIVFSSVVSQEALDNFNEIVPCGFLNPTELIVKLGKFKYFFYLMLNINLTFDFILR